ncbi:hypothetical protein [Methylobacter sp.]|uniref:hypothetical protein n=1 Tax=Methylobacter sp. TaxID=2051955 RepID=UPI001227824A|nr:hypothetical protein [Methylobacter sp.]TAK59543.1 MAG: hypothetical protein EPO18_20490 [Methylobacter sp.]
MLTIIAVLGIAGATIYNCFESRERVQMAKMGLCQERVITGSGMSQTSELLWKKCKEVAK